LVVDLPASIGTVGFSLGYVSLIRCSYWASVCIVLKGRVEGVVLMGKEGYCRNQSMDLKGIGVSLEVKYGVNCSI
jgi:hypothetical protein